jgi:ubiquinone/menaquinone biosynthesis C-methylase UbiE
MVEWVKRRDPQELSHLDELDFTAGIDSMRDNWNNLANENSMHYIASEKDNWEERDFFASGERDIARHLDPVMERLRFSPQGKKLLEIGCGVGRLSFSLVKRFGEVDALDISPQMIKRAIEYQEKFCALNVRFHVGSGKDLAGFGNEEFDFCFSYIVFQHIPSVNLIFDYVREMGRVLKPGGMFLFQVNGYRHLRLSGSRYVMLGVRDTGRLRKWGVRRRPFLRIGRLNFWYGAPVKRLEMLRVCESAGLDIKEIIGGHSQYLWFAGQKMQLTHD